MVTVADVRGGRASSPSFGVHMTVTASVLTNRLWSSVAVLPLETPLIDHS